MTVNYKLMYKNSLLFLIVPAVLGVSSCRQHYELTDISRSRILFDSCYDVSPDKEDQAFLAPYEHKVDSIMSPVVGETAEYLSSHKPESPLSNLLADILQWGGNGFNEKVDFASYASPRMDRLYSAVKDMVRYFNECGKVDLVQLTESVLEESDREKIMGA